MVPRLLLVAACLLATLPVPAPALAQPAPAPAVDPPDLQRTYDEAFDAFSRRDFARAALGFDAVAAQSVDPTRRETAHQMAERARSQMATQGQAPQNAYAVPPSATTSSGAPAEPEEDGRAWLIRGSAAFGLLFYGWAVPVAFDVSDARAVTGIYMLTAAASIGLPFLLTQGKKISEGTATLAIAGATVGIAHAALAGLAIGGPSAWEEHARGMTGALVVGSLVEGAAGFAWASSTDMSPGTALMLSSGALYGSGVGAGIAYLAQVDEIEDRDSRARGLALFTIGGSVLGIIGGKILADHRHYTAGEVELMQTSTPLALAVAGLPLAWAEAKDPEPIAATLMGGFAVGVWASDRLVAHKTFTKSESGIVGLSTLGGALLTTGLMYVLNVGSPDDITAAKIYYTGAVGGAVAGFALGYSMLGAPAGSRRISASRRGPMVIAPLVDSHTRGVSLSFTLD